ncbi:hypothetical protein DUI87_11342 [Hirundo rustica rustica]|uniref:ribonuclease H n=1 Tax=Hirundo rustica rustica TaxID=333673 RepID=A0A3M0KGF1_HIRRU|nr:hypothetical protein DUI87_11342 [Hirundo rustica rustica]
MGRDLRVSGGPVETAALTPPLSEPRRQDSGGRGSLRFFLVILLYRKWQRPVQRGENRLQGSNAFGSTGLPQVHWTAVLTKDHPEKLCTLSIPGATPPEIRLHRLLDTVQEQLDQGHLEPSTSPWNTPVFCIKKKSGKWMFLQDLWEVNAVVKTMGALQAGMPLPTMLPTDLPVHIMNQKDCFFTIPLNPGDRPKFAFSVPAINTAEPTQQYQWRVLPLGCCNSPAMCQWYVARALSGVHKQFPDDHFYHYMDDILVAVSTQDELLRVQPQLINALHSHGLQVAPEKVQQQTPWKYLGVKILEQTVQHQEVQFVHSVKTLNDAQKFVSVISWLHLYLGLTMTQLSPLFDLLKGDSDLKSPHTLTPEACQELEEVQRAVSAHQVYCIDPSVDVTLFVTTPDLHPTDIIGQWNDKWSDFLHGLEWIFLPHQPQEMATTLFELIARLIIKC